jgi:ribosomal-protein-alanine N-acetyltransferase
LNSATIFKPSQTSQPQAIAFVAMDEKYLPEVVRIEQENMDFPWTAGNFRDSMKAGHHCVVLIQQEAVIGFAVLMMVLDEAHLLNIGIDKRYRGQGLGKQLLRWVMQTARTLGGLNLFLEVRPSNHVAIKLYESIGMNEMGLRPGYYPALHGREDALLMGCAL